jgi:hypothetical protein
MMKLFSTYVIGVTGIIGLSACVAIDGGAVEVGWQLRNASTEVPSRHLDCSETSFDSVRLELQPSDSTLASPCTTAPCSETNCCLFRCDQEIGVTGFVIPPGHYSMQITATLAENQGQERSLESSNGVTTPAPVVREVRTGEVTALGVNLIIVDSNR